MRKTWLAAFMVALATMPAFAEDTSKTMQSQATQMVDGVSGNFSSSKQISANMASPVSGSGQMKTLDGKTQFSGKMVCKGTAEYAKFIIQPQSNGNVKMLNMFLDSDLDGKLDQTSTPGWEMSAICANGYMYCEDSDNAATCNPYKWTGNPFGRSVASITELGGCYCINNKCGNSLVWRNLNQVVSDIGTGLAGALASANPQYTLSSVNVDGIQGTLTGGDTGSCVVGDTSGFTTTSSVKTSAGYLDNVNKMTSAAEAQTSSNQAYKALKDGSVNANETSDTRSCEITRNVGIDEPKLTDIITFEGGEGDILQCGSDCLTLAIGKIGDNYLPGGRCTYFDYQSKFYVHDSSRIKTATLVKTKFDDWMQLWVAGTQIYSAPYTWTGEGGVPGSCELSTEWQFSPNQDFSPHLKNNGPVIFRTRVAVGGEGEAYALLKITADTSCRVGQENIFNGCTAYEQDTQCNLIDETIDGVKTFIEGMKTGLSPLEQTTMLQGNFCSVPVTKPWFKKKRSYRCNRNLPIDLTKEKDRVKFIKENTTPTQYKDKQFTAIGTVKYDQGPLNFGTLPTVGECTNVCKTRSVVNGSSMSLAGSVSSRQVTPSYSYNYYQCTSDNQCPAGEGETIMKQCQCLNEFTDAAAIMQIMRQAGNDMICSSGNTSNP